jgi:hypothetical protein
MAPVAQRVILSLSASALVLLLVLIVQQEAMGSRRGT